MKWKRHLRILGKVEAKLILDTGADANFTFAPFWQNRSECTTGPVTITRLGRRTCKPITVSPAFGISNMITQQVQLKVQLSPTASIEPWFYLLPQRKAGTFLGKPLLRKLKFQLDEDSESVIVDGERIEIPENPGIGTAHSTFLRIQQSDALTQLKKKFPGLFATTFSLDVKHKYEAHVTLQDFAYTKPKATFYSGIPRGIIQEYVNQSLENGLIVPIATDEIVALSPVFAIRQSAEKVRVVTNLRAVNKALKYTPRPIPTTQSILPDLSRKRVFSAIDIRKAYQQIPLTSDPIGIITEFGSYRFTRLPYALASAPYWWGEFLQSILAKLPPHLHTVTHYYYDDIIVASEDPEEHQEVLHALFKLLVQHGLSISEEKLQLQQDHVFFLGYEIRHNRVTIEPSKIEAIQKWVLPNTKSPS